MEDIEIGEYIRSNERNIEAFEEMLEMVYPRSGKSIQSVLLKVEYMLKGEYKDIDFEFKLYGSQLQVMFYKLGLYKVKFSIQFDLNCYTKISRLEEELFYQIKSSVEEAWLSLLKKER